MSGPGQQRQRIQGWGGSQARGSRAPCLSLARKGRRDAGRNAHELVLHGRAVCHPQAPDLGAQHTNCSSRGRQRGNAGASRPGHVMLGHDMPDRPGKNDGPATAAGVPANRRLLPCGHGRAPRRRPRRFPCLPRGSTHRALFPFAGTAARAGGRAAKPAHSRHDDSLYRETGAANARTAGRFTCGLPPWVLGPGKNIFLSDQSS